MQTIGESEMSALITGTGELDREIPALRRGFYTEDLHPKSVLRYPNQEQYLDSVQNLDAKST